MARIAEHPKHFLLKIVRLVVRVAIVDPGQLHTNTGFFIELLSDATREDCMKEALETDSLSIDDRLRLLNHLSLRLHQGDINAGLRPRIGNPKIDLGLFLELIHHLGCHKVARKALLRFRRVINGGLMLRYHTAADLYQFDQVLRHFHFISSSCRSTPHQRNRRHPHHRHQEK